MSISTYSTYKIASSDMSALQTDLQHYQKQLDTQQRVVTPSDDPVAAAQILSLEQSKGRTKQYLVNNGAAESTLALSEGIISSAVDLMGNMKALAIRTVNGADTPETLKIYQLVARQGFDQLLSYANSANGSGGYLYSGSKINTVPFAVDQNLNVTYQGDSNQLQLPVASNAIVAITDPGSAIFGTPVAPTAAFQALKKLHDILGQDPQPANYADQMLGIINDISAAQEQMVKAQTSIGVRRKTNEDLAGTNTGMKLQYDIGISYYQDLDIYKTISDYTLTREALEYSQQVYAQISKMSLFNFIGS